MRVLGISAFYHDSAAALVVDGRIVAAAQEERFTRKKHDSNFPRHAIDYCLSAGSIELGNVDYVAFYDKPFLKFERLLETYLAFAPKGFRSFRMAMPIWLREKLFQKNLLLKELRKIDPKFIEEQLTFTEHHLSHAASAFFPSPFSAAAILTMDGVGEWATTSFAVGRDEALEIQREIHFPHSLGLLYSAFTYYTGFKVNSGEYKIMGLAPYGTPRFAQTIRDHLIDIKADGSYRLNMEYFDYCTGLTMTNDNFHKLFGGQPRKPEEILTQREMDLTASIQAVLEEVVVKLARSIAKDTGLRNLCMAGGVALNCVANGKILREGAFENIWIQPASGDAGGALGAALSVSHGIGNVPHLRSSGLDGMQGAYLGPSYGQDDIEKRLKVIGANFEVLPGPEIIATTVSALTAGCAVGWFQGRMEFGPRALGNRSILGDPRSPKMQSLLNLKVKYRESFRPFAPSILRERVAEWFEIESDSPYMLLVADVVKNRRFKSTTDEEKLFGIEKLNVPRSEIPAVTHVDYSARIQTVHKDTNPLYHALLSAFEKKTNCPIVVNTSFNVRGEPLVCSPEDAYRCFMGTEIEMLVIGNCVLRKEKQDAKHKLNYETIFELD
ncbi:MAG TPA: carbamoyltransferase [Aestuariivirga sp.]|nr:carbamoyltransferase [Aestuariivirga sp.]